MSDLLRGRAGCALLRLRARLCLRGVCEAGGDLPRVSEGCQGGGEDLSDLIAESMYVSMAMWRRHWEWLRIVKRYG